MINVKTTGDWNIAISKLRDMATNIMPSSEQALDKAGEMTKELIQSHIDKQDLGWTPLSKRSLEVKGHGKIYIDTGTLRSGIQAKKVKQSNNEVSIFVGVSDGSHPSGLDLLTVMKYNEYGTRKSPARPLIRPSVEEAQPKILRIVNESLSKSLK